MSLVQGEGVIKLRLMALCVFGTIPAAGFANEIFAVTPSGSAEMLFSGKAAEVAGKISGRCMDLRWTVVSSNETTVVCDSPLSTGQSIMGQLLLGNSYSTPPKRFFRFTISENAGISRVQAAGWMETQMAFGQIQRVDFSGADFQNSIMGFMGAAGGKFPVGTTFPNHVVMGVDVEATQQGRYAAMRITGVRPDSAAMRAGIVVGDVVTRVAGRRFKNDDEYLAATEKAASSATYPVELTRNGATITLTLDREFRPAYVEEVLAQEEHLKTPSTGTPSSSVADELAKLLKLKEQGVLTQEEFDSQKVKLLTQ
ncbi:PDZ domain-containing protein [Stenotrophomonas sp. ATCM1_4]|uniref:PDZ domain-containing protein n=1 Tax=Stenotrophomonas sp. ATCM1_4 TaxID=2259330 RepID=UPI001FB7F143|nr:PDZ domain-containing protein [Stenotrophomonas sp. ATCM1_4]